MADMHFLSLSPFGENGPNVEYSLKSYVMQYMIRCLKYKNELKTLLRSVHTIHFLDPIKLLELLQLIEMLICVTNFFEFEK